MHASLQQLFHLHIALPSVDSCALCILCSIHVWQSMCAFLSHHCSLASLTHVTGGFIIMQIVLVRALLHCSTDLYFVCAIRAAALSSLPALGATNELYLDLLHPLHLQLFFMQLYFANLMIGLIKITTTSVLQSSIISPRHYSIIRMSCIPKNPFWNGPTAILDLILAQHLQSKFKKKKVLHGDILPLNSLSRFSSTFHSIINSATSNVAKLNLPIKKHI